MPSLRFHIPCPALILDAPLLIVESSMTPYGCLQFKFEEMSTIPEYLLYARLSKKSITKHNYPYFLTD